MIIRRIPLAVLVASLALSVWAGSSLASPIDGGRTSSKSERGGGSTSTSATLTASPNPVAAWSLFYLSGCGYVPGKQTTIVINHGTFFGASVDANGCLVPPAWWASGPGSYLVEAYQKLKSRRQTLMGSTTLSVI